MRRIGGLEVEEFSLRRVILPFVWLVAGLGACRAHVSESGSAAERVAEPAVQGDAGSPAQIQALLEGDEREAARALLSATVAQLAEPGPGEEEAHVAYVLELDRLAGELGALEDSRQLCEQVLAVRERQFPEDAPERLAACEQLGIALWRLKRFEEAHALFLGVEAAWGRLLPSDHPEHLEAMECLAATTGELGDFARARELQEEVLAARLRTLPADDPMVLMVKQNLAGTRWRLGDLDGAHELFAEVHAANARLRPPGHPDLLRAQQNLALSAKKRGDLAGARELERAVLEGRLRLFPADHPEVLMAQLNLADTLRDMGELDTALALDEAVVAGLTRTLPSEHPELLKAKANLAASRRYLGDFEGARELDEAVLAVWTRTLAPDDPALLIVQGNQALNLKELGDLPAARALEEAVLWAQLRLHPADHEAVLLVKNNLSQTLRGLGDQAGALALIESVLEARQRLDPPGAPRLLVARGNHAVLLAEMGQLEAARAILEENVAVLEQRHGPDHELLLAAQQSLAEVRRALGDLVGARDLGVAAVEGWERVRQPAFPKRLKAQLGLAQTFLALGETAAAHELLSELLAGLRVRARSLQTEAPRPAREGARAALRVFSDALELAPSGVLDREFLATLETLRQVELASPAVALAQQERPELEELARRAREARQSLNDLIAADLQADERDAAWRAEVLRFAGLRDEAERELRRRVAEAGAPAADLDLEQLAARLAPRTAAVSFLRLSREPSRGPEGGKGSPPDLLAFVVLPGGAVRRLALGPGAELEALVEAWRHAIGKPLERGIAAGADRSELELGRTLRARFLDPVLAAAGEVEALHVVLDDALHLVPLDALPLEGEGLVGQRVRIHLEPALASLLSDERPAEAGTLLALGGIDFDAELGNHPGASERRHAALGLATTPPLERSGRPARFEELRQTRYEVEDVVAQYREVRGGEPIALLGAEATKAALLAQASRARYLHLATHGWFASEAIRSQVEAPEAPGARALAQSAEELVTGFAPEALCGLALAGANRGRDALGRVPGILTAEELAGFDLRRCELAVLSACETNVGIRRAGQGIQSLQSALHAAGARTAITSLWRVDDAATRRLFELFYARLWRDGLGKAEALWQARLALRAEGHPTRDWAGWVMTGDGE